jgi:hypothetical protein
VTRWEWAAGEADWERPEPLFTVRRGAPMVTRASKQPSCELGFVVRYGYDGDDRIVVARRAAGGTVEHPDRTGELIWVEGLDGARVLLEYRYDGLRRAKRGLLYRITRPTLTNGLLQEVRRWGFGGGRGSAERDRYGRTDGRLDWIEEDLFRDGEWVPSWRYSVTYTDGGKLAAVVATKLDQRGRPSSDPVVSYRRRSPKAVRDAKRRVAVELPERIERWARRMAPEEPVFALACLYSFEGPEMPPALALGTERERVAVLASRHDVSDIWNPAEWSLLDADPDELRDDGFGECLSLLADEWNTALDDRQPRATLIGAVKQLAKRRWDRVLRPAGAFAVYAIDDELTDLDRNLKASVPAHARTAIESRA